MMLDEDPRQTEETMRDMVNRIITDGRELAEAEFELLKARIVSELMRYKVPAILAGVAAMIALGGLVALFWGIAAALALEVGPLWAGVITVTGALLLAALLGLMAKARLEKK